MPSQAYPTEFKNLKNVIQKRYELLPVELVIPF